MGSRPQWVLAVAVAVIVAAALLTVVLTWRHPAEVAPGSPAAAVRTYLGAVLDHDSEAAVRMLTPDSPCDVEDVDHAYVDDDLRASLRDVDVRGTTARVEVAITAGAGGLIPAEWTDLQIFRLVRTDGTWLISDSPWPLFECGGAK